MDTQNTNTQTLISTPTPIKPTTKPKKQKNPNWGGHRKGAGRPAPAGERRDGHMIKFSPGEWEQIQARAKRLRITAAEYIRRKTLAPDASDT